MKKTIVTVLITLLVSVLGTLGLCFIQSGELVKWRDIWIETAMGTFHHKWLATWFFSDSVIDEVMDKKIETTEYMLQEQVTESPTAEPEAKIFGQYMKKSSGDVDYVGNVIYDVNKEQEIVIVELDGDNYKGKLAIIEDPSRVFIGHTSNINSVGNNILTFLNRYNAILGVNASGFADYKGIGNGGEVMGLSCSEGNYWGDYTDSYNTIALTEDNKLIVGVIPDWQNANIRDGCQFNPALILNGIKQVDGTAGWGMQPRTAIGQRADGAILILTIDGRKIGYSIGATMEDVADELVKYDVVTAAAVDGGSSTIMGYDGNIITKCSSPQQGGRYLPNAILVRKM